MPPWAGIACRSAERPDVRRDDRAQRKDDARISLQEYVNALFKDFEAADSDSDGLLTVEEIEVYRTRTR